MPSDQDFLSRFTYRLYCSSILWFAYSPVNHGVGLIPVSAFFNTSIPHISQVDGSTMPCLQKRQSSIGLEHAAVKQRLRMVQSTMSWTLRYFNANCSSPIVAQPPFLFQLQNIRELDLPGRVCIHNRILLLELLIAVFGLKHFPFRFAGVSTQVDIIRNQSPVFCKELKRPASPPPMSLSSPHATPGFLFCPIFSIALFRNASRNWFHLQFRQGIMEPILLPHETPATGNLYHGIFWSGVLGINTRWAERQVPITFYANCLKTKDFISALSLKLYH